MNALTVDKRFLITRGAISYGITFHRIDPANFDLFPQFVSAGDITGALRAITNGLVQICGNHMSTTHISRIHIDDYGIYFEGQGWALMYGEPNLIKNYFAWNIAAHKLWPEPGLQQLQEIRRHRIIAQADGEGVAT